MEYFKNAIDYSDQIAILKQRGLLIDDENEALAQLKIISYFRLANYLRPMEQNKQTHQFKPNSHFNNALSLYYFDKKLRALIFTAIQSVEIAMRSKMIHFISMKYGPFWFMNNSLYSNQSLFNDNLSHIRKEVTRSREDFIEDI